jgi:hypothetical protein
MIKRVFSWVGFVMSVALSMVVDGLVTLKDRQTLEQMREHRQHLRERLLKSRNRLFDPSKLVSLYETEVEVIETGLQKLD